MAGVIISFKIFQRNYIRVRRFIRYVSKAAAFPLIMRGKIRKQYVEVGITNSN